MALPSKKNSEFSAAYYKRRRQQLKNKGVVAKKHSNSTRNNINEISQRWKKYCDHCHEAEDTPPCLGQDDRDKDSRQCLIRADRDEVMLFLEWILDHYPSRKRISIRQKFKHWRQLYRKYAEQQFPEQWSVEINDYINGSLALKYKLDIKTKEKPVADVDDVYRALHHNLVGNTTFADERQRLQLAFIILICAYTASRPGALVYVKRNVKVVVGCALDAGLAEPDSENIEYGDSHLTSEDLESMFECLRYKDVNLVLVPNPDGDRDKLAMEVDLQFTKGHKRNYKRKIFCLYEVDDLIFDPTILMINFGLLDKAFELDFRNVEDIFRLRVLEPRKKLRLRWKKAWENKPICRQAIASANGIETSRDEPLPYATFLYYLQRLGMMAGFMDVFNPYNIRRGAGEVVEAIGTQGQLQQVMNQKDAGIFQAYINERIQCDVQAAFLGKPSDTALIKAMSHMSQNIDPRAPTQLTQCEVNDLKIHTPIVQLRAHRDALSQAARRKYTTIRRAQEAKSIEYLLYKEAQSNLENAKKSLLRSTLKESRADFFDRIDTEDARKQLDVLAVDLKEEIWTPGKVFHTPERNHVIELLTKSSLSLTEEERTKYRVDTIKALICLCGQRQEKSKTTQRVLDWGLKPFNESDRDHSNKTHIDEEQTKSPLQIMNNECIFCVGKTGQKRAFCRPLKAREHVERQHLVFFRNDDLIPCPDPCCRSSGTILYGHNHFKNHLAQVHGCILSQART